MHTSDNSKQYNLKSNLWHDEIEGSIAHRYLEKPAMASLISDLQFKDVLCIGVGSGEELSEILKYNPKRVVCIDVAEDLLKIAKAKYPSIEILVMDMMELDFEDESFDFIYSSLVFHYSKDWDLLLSGIKRILRPGGILLFSTHNPDAWSHKEETGGIYTNSRGIALKEHKAIINSGVEIVFYNHQNLDCVYEAVEHSGLVIDTKVLPQLVKPYIDLSERDQERYDSLKKKNSKTPIFVIVRAHK